MLQPCEGPRYLPRGLALAMPFPRERSLVTRESKELLVGCTVCHVPGILHVLFT